MELFDTHAHVFDKKFTRDWQQVLERMKEAEVTQVMCVGFDVASSEKAAAMAQSRPGFWAVAGVHPHDAAKTGPNYLARLEKLAKQPKVAALGETGLDYFRDLSPRDVQRKVFKEQLALTRELNLPVVIHARDAYGDLMDILRKDGISSAGGVVHCFSGSWEIAVEAMGMGFYISIAGPVTYPKSFKLKEIARRLKDLG